MTARPIDPESLRRPLRIAVALVLVLVTALLVAGCMNQATKINTILQSPINQTPVITQTPETLPIIAPSGTPCPQTNETPYIIINPIGTHYMGEIFEINGTTNLGFGERLLYKIARPVEPRPLNSPGNYSVTSGYTEIVNGDCIVRHWSFQFNSSEFPSPVNNVIISARNSTVSNFTSFVIHGTSKY